ncbi:MAG: site-2 protease family protein, partial [Syntrophobacteraceae bacterium]|nr:site-2 protease family protein [Syntrophobacteraceae bacterium]
MSWSLKIITVHGIPIRVHLSFLLIVLWSAYIGLSGGSSEWLRGAAFMVVFTLLLFLCVVLHELGHSLVAQLFGVKVHDITLWPIGGVARLAKLPERPYQEFLITAAGPAVNIL